MNDLLVEELGRYRTAYCLAKALKEEIVILISKAENIPAEEALKRIDARTEQLFQEVKENFSRRFEQA